MRKSMHVCLLLLLMPAYLLAQYRKTDSLRHLLASEKSDTVKVRLLNELGELYTADTANLYWQQALELANKLDYPNGRRITLMNLFLASMKTGDYTKAVSYALLRQDLAERTRDTVMLYYLYGSLAFLYRELEYPDLMLEFTRKRQVLVDAWANRPPTEKMTDIKRQTFNSYGAAFALMNQMDSARFYRRLAYQLAKEQNDNTFIAAFFSNIGLTFLDENPDSALHYSQLAVQQARKGIRPAQMGRIGTGMANVYLKRGQLGSALYYGRIGFVSSKEAGQLRDMRDAAALLHQLYARKKRMDSAYTYLLIVSNLNDSVFGSRKIKEIQTLNYNERTRIEKQTQTRMNEQARRATNLKLTSLAAGSGTLLLFVLFLVRNNRQKQKANLLLQQQQRKTEQAMEELKATQQQLIYQEKLASLGELTAGIAHESQNPLNFVNNFSEANKELLEELEMAIERGDRQEVKALATDLKANEAKISHHGRRADNIVKGMLQHARSSTGNKETTNINKLADEYLRLSYQGMRAKNKAFNSSVQTHFDEGVGNVSVAPQDIGRVLLNLYNNAFYAVQEKKAKCNGTFEPVVSVSTVRDGNNIAIIVKDNGTGIPEQVRGKIFQPFFTTKPTGEGTGLGLSLSYDIIAKAHGGNLTVQSREGEGSEFVIELPVV